MVEHLAPVSVGLIGGHEGRTGFLTLAEDLEEQIGTGLVDRQTTQLIDEQNLEAKVFPEFGFEAAGSHQTSTIIA